MIGTFNKHIGYLLLAALLWSSGGLLIKWVDWNPMAIAGARSVIASLVILMFMDKFSIKRQFNNRYMWMAAISYAATVVSFVMATKMTTAANAILLQFTAPIYVALLSAWLLNEAPRSKDWVFIVAVMAGMLLFFMDKLEAMALTGNLIGVFSGMAFGLFILMMRKVRHRDPLAAIWMGNIIAALICLPAMFQSMPSATSCLGIGMLGIFQLGLPYFFYARAVPHVKALDTTFILLIEPVLNPLWVFLAFGEVPGFWALIGGILVLSVVTARNVMK